MKNFITTLLLVCSIFCLSACISSESPQMKNEGEFSCTVSIKCETILNNMDKLSPGKKDFIPSDGVILNDYKVFFSDKTDSFEILKKACLLNNIHLEFSSTAMDTVYVEGINQIYEFDCGSLSGWQYFINRENQSLGAAQYEVKDGDRIDWIYMCDMGEDIKEHMK